MIPKVIHYCWFGNTPLPKLAKRCIQSWKKFLPDYQIMFWNENNFDVSCCKYAADAYKEKKYAFVSDFVRFYIIYQQGGIYLDTDVELIKPLDVILENGAFMGCENMATDGGLNVAPGLGIGAEAGLPFYKEMIDLYNEISFYKEDGSLNLKTVVIYTTEKLREHGLRDNNTIQEICGIKVYPKDFFSPIDTRTRKKHITPNTVSIHYYAGSWVEKKSSRMSILRLWIVRTFGESFYNGLRRIKLWVFPTPWKWE